MIPPESRFDPAIEIYPKSKLVANLGRSQLRHHKDATSLDLGPPPFSVSVADKGLSVAVSGLESTVAGGVCKC